MKPHTATQAHTARQAGYSLVEIGVAVAIVAMLVLVALTGVQNILTANKISQQVRNVARLTSNAVAINTEPRLVGPNREFFHRPFVQPKRGGLPLRVAGGVSGLRKRHSL